MDLFLRNTEDKSSKWKMPNFWSILFLFFIFLYAGFLLKDSVLGVATPSAIITYQGKLMNSGTAVDETVPMGFLIYNDVAAGSLLYTASGTIGATSTVDVAVSQGIFSINFGGSDTNAFDDTIFANNNELYLEVWINGTKLSPRKRLTSAPFAMNSAYLMGYGVATASTSEYIPRSDANGNFAFTGAPTSNDVSGGTMFINPGAADANDTVFGIGLGGSERFRVDAEGDLSVIGNLTATGTATGTFTNLEVTDGITLGGVKQTSWPTGGGTGDVIAAGDNMFLGLNSFGATTTFSSTTFNGKVTFNTGTVFSVTSTMTNLEVTDGITLGGVKQTSWPTGGGTGDVVAADDNIFTGNNYLATTTVTGTLAVHGQALFDGNTRNISVADIYDTGASAAYGVKLVNNLAYVITADVGVLNIFNISDPENIILLGSYTEGGSNSYLDVEVMGDYAFVASHSSGGGGNIRMFDVSNPSSPTLLGSVVYDASDLAVEGNLLYAVGSNGLEIYRVGKQNGYGQMVAVGSSPGSYFSIAVDGNYAYALNTANVYTFNVAIPDSPLLIDTIVGAEDHNSVFIEGNYLYVPLSFNGVEIYDITDRTNPVLLSTFDPGSGTTVESFSISGNYAYAGYGTTLKVYDLSNKSSPLYKTSLSVGSDAVWKSSVFGSILGIANNAGELILVDLHGVDIANLSAGSAQVSNLDVISRGRFGNSVDVRGGLSVGSGILVNGNLSFVLPTSSVSYNNIISFSHTAKFINNIGYGERDEIFVFDTLDFQEGYGGPPGVFHDITDMASTTAIMSVRNRGIKLFSVFGNGDIGVAGRLYASSTVIGTPGSPGDLAERVDIAIDDEVEPGDVVVVDPNETDTYRKSTSAYAQEISGVISTNPTIVIGNGDTEKTAVMAMVGRVPIKVSAENGAIARGDLLVSADTPGYAMKYDATKDSSGHVAGIIGVALESLSSGRAKIMGLVRTGWISNQGDSLSAVKDELQKLSDAMVAKGKEESNLSVGESSNGTLVSLGQDFDANGFALLNVKNIEGLSGLWQIDEKGRLVTKVDTRDGEKNLYALQSGADQFVFSGSSVLHNGVARVDFEKYILDIIDTNEPMSVNLTLTSDARGLYVKTKDENGFEVKEVDGGQSEATFDWVVIAARRSEKTPITRENSESVLQEPAPQEENNSSTKEASSEPVVVPEDLPVENTTSTPVEEVVEVSEPVPEEPVVESVPENSSEVQ